jgi:hypothetical protein
MESEKRFAAFDQIMMAVLALKTQDLQQQRYRLLRIGTTRQSRLAQADRSPGLTVGSHAGNDARSATSPVPANRASNGLRNASTETSPSVSQAVYRAAKSLGITRRQHEYRFQKR